MRTQGERLDHTGYTREYANELNGCEWHNVGRNVG